MGRRLSRPAFVRPAQAPRCPPRASPRAPIALALALAALPAPSTGQPSVISREEALAAAFPGADISLERLFLTGEQVERIAALSREKVSGKLWVRYVATLGDEVVGRAYVDTHVVRTKRESLLISLEPDGRLRRIDVTAFLEPPEYQAPEAWLAQYRGKPLGDDLSLQRAIRPIAGATLTARAVNAAVRRVQAMDIVLEGREAPRSP